MELTDDMRRVVNEQRLGFVATVGPDGRPNLSPKGTTMVWDASHLMFADVSSPATVANLAVNPFTEINVVDPIARKGYRFKGRATFHRSGAEFDHGMALLRDRGSSLTAERVRSIVVVEVLDTAPLVSPVYDTGITEPSVVANWMRHYTGLHQQVVPAVDPGDGAEAVLLTGVYGVGKTTVAADIASVLETAGVAHAALDLDWLTWSNASGPTRTDEHQMMLTNLASIVANYRGVGARYFVLARSIVDRFELASLIATVVVPVRTVELTVSYEVIAERLATDPTDERRDNLAASARWLANALGTGFADVVIANDRPVRDVSSLILTWLDWPAGPTHTT